MNIVELRAKLAKAEQKTNTSNSLSYQHWKLNVGESASLRFLPFSEEDEPLFFKETHIRTLEFPCSDQSTDPVFITIPSMTMYEESDLINEYLKPLWETDEATARANYHKKAFLAYGFVTKDPTGKVPSDSQLCRFKFTNSIYQKIRDGLIDEELGLDNHPCDTQNGTNFVIKKTQKGEYANYESSGWAKRETPLNEAQMKVYDNDLLSINQLGFKHKPTDLDQKVMFKMFKDSLEGERFVGSNYGNIYVPYNYKVSID